MESLEIHPIISRIVCLNRPHLKPWWVTSGLSAVLHCFYNPHQPQIISTEISLQLPKPRIIRVRGHTSHHLPSEEIPKLKVQVQMGTYLMFYIPKSNSNSSWSLVINGVESVLRETHNHPEFSIHVMQNSGQLNNFHLENTGKGTNRLKNGRSEDLCENHTIQPPPEPPVSSLQSLKINPSKLPTVVKLEDPETNNSGPSGISRVTENKDVNPPKDSGSSRVLGSEYVGDSVASFENADKLTSLLDDEEDDEIVDDESGSTATTIDDDTEPICKVVVRRLVIDINQLKKAWQKSLDCDDSVLTLLLKPRHDHQAWQFLSSWITVSDRREEQAASTLSRRKCVMKKKPPVIHQLLASD